MKKLFLPFVLVVVLIGAQAFAQVNNARMLSGVHHVFGTSYPIAATDVSYTVSFESASAVGAALANPMTIGFGAGTIYTVQNNGAGTVTITCSACTINLNATLTLLTGQGADIYSDGANYTALSTGAGGGGGGGGVSTLQNLACSSMNSNSAYDAPCANNFNAFGINSAGTSAVNLAHGIAFYYQGDLQQNIGGNGHMGTGVFNASALLNGLGGSGARLAAIAGDAVATGNATGSMGDLNWARGRLIINSGATVGNAITFLSYNPFIAAGATVGDVGAFFADNPTILGTVTGKVYSFRGGGSNVDFAYWGKDGAKIAVFAANDQIPNSFCHLGSGDGLVKDCWPSGTGSPIGVMAGNVGSIFSRQDGAAGSAFYGKESGTGNTGWARFLTGSLGTPNKLPLWITSSGEGTMGNSALSDNGTDTITSTEQIVVNTPGAGILKLDQGTDNSGTCPAANVCDQAPTVVTTYTNTRPGTAAQGVVSGTLSGAVIKQGISGDSNHSAAVTTSSTTSIASTPLCSTTFCPAGVYRLNAYLDVTTQCGTSGTYSASAIWTDDTGAAKTVVIPIQGTGVTAGVLTTGNGGGTANVNFGQAAMILRSNGAAAISYLTTAVACGSAGPMAGKLYLSLEAVQ